MSQHPGVSEQTRNGESEARKQRDTRSLRRKETSGAVSRHDRARLTTRAKPGVLSFPGTLKGEQDVSLALREYRGSPLPVPTGVRITLPEATLLLNLSFQGDPRPFRIPGLGDHMGARPVFTGAPRKWGARQTAEATVLPQHGHLQKHRPGMGPVT